ncbi:MAG: nucleotidyltransferase family protein [Acidobacteria bacterium]|nr:nucleotidyltransferase family protein [Acidobacteriota bacterium]
MAITLEHAEEKTLTASASPEVELLLLCGRPSLDAQAKARLVKLSARGVEWGEVSDLAWRHGLVPLLFARLSEFCRGVVPGDVLASVREQFARASALNVYLSDELRRLLRLFAERGVEAMPYKGPALAVAAYGDVRLRQFCDLDIVVRARDTDTAIDALGSRGFAPYGDLDAARQAFVRRTQHNLAFTRDRDRTVVELHWDVASRGFSRAVEAEGLWARSRAGEFEGVPARALAPEDLLLALCVHGTKHVWERLGWLCDIARLVEREAELDWRLIAARAREGGCARMLAVALDLARELFGADLPRGAELLIESDASARKLSRRLAPRLLTAEGLRPGAREYFLFQLRARERRADRARYIVFALRPTERDLTMALPRRLSFVYYLLRPLRMAWTGGPPHLRAGKK